MPREVQDMFIAGIPRLQAQLSILHADAHMYTKLTEEGRNKQRTAWIKVLQASDGQYTGDVYEAILNGTLTDPDEIGRLLPNTKVASSFEDVEEFFAAQ